MNSSRYDVPMNTREPFWILIPEDGLKHGEAAYLLEEFGASYKNVEFHDSGDTSPMDALVVLERGQALGVAMCQFPGTVLFHVDANGEVWLLHPYGAFNEHLGHFRCYKTPKCTDMGANPIFGTVYDKQTGMGYEIPAPNTKREVPNATGG